MEHNPTIWSLIPWVTAVKAITAGQLALASDGVYSVSLDEAIEAMRLTAAGKSRFVHVAEACMLLIYVTVPPLDMSVKYKETSLSVRTIFVWILIALFVEFGAYLWQGLAVSLCICVPIGIGNVLTYHVS